MQANINVRPGQPQAPQAPRQFAPNEGGPSYQAPGRNSRLPWILLVLVVVIVAVVLGFLFRDKLGMSKADEVSEYQAVFLTNGQVYFGKLADKSSRYVTLKDIYYLQVNQPLQQTSGQQTDPQQQPQLSLVKLGNELHGPVDEMAINRDHILFLEDIKKDGRVAQAIAEYKANPNAGNTQTPPATQTPSTTPPATTTPPAQK
jgi:hypothetical protein